MIYLNGKKKKDLKLIIRLMKILKVKIIEVYETVTGGSTETIIHKIDCSKQK